MRVTPSSPATYSSRGDATRPTLKMEFPDRCQLLPIVAALLLPLVSALHAATPLNILFFTADDMNYDSAGVFGGPIRDLTPNVDKLAASGMSFEYAYSTVAVCQPVRQTMQTALYPHRSGSMGFYPIKPGVRTLNQQLHDAGYLISLQRRRNRQSHCDRPPQLRHPPDSLRHSRPRHQGAFKMPLRAQLPHDQAFPRARAKPCSPSRREQALAAGRICPLS